MHEVRPDKGPSTADQQPTANRTLADLQSQATNLDRARNRELFPSYFDRVALRLIAKEGFEPDLAVRVTDEAFGFIKVAALHGGPSRAFTPTKLVDEAWHAAILFTREYEQLCRSLGRDGLVHHAPHDHPDEVDGKADLQATVDFFRAEGIVFDEELWTFSLTVDSSTNCCANCSGCNAGGWCNGT